MDKKTDIRSSIDNARLMTRLAVIGGIAALILLVLTLIFSVIRPEIAGSDLFSLAVIPYSLAILFSLAGMIYGMLGTAAAQESEEKQLLDKRLESRALNVEEDVRFTAGRSFDNYRRFAPYALALLGAGLVALLLVVFHNYWGGRLEGKVPPSNALNAAVLAFIMMLLSVFSGAFFVGQSRSPAFRWLRAVGAWLLAGFGIMFCSMVVSVFTHNNFTNLDEYVATVVYWILAVLGAEFIVSFIIEFYRPRTLKETQPIFESRLLSLFTEPGGVMRNIALALDYQFGFKVSGTWLYSFMERSFFPLVLFWAVILWGFTMIHEVGPSEVGVRIRLGKVVSTELLQPGIYWTMPWPFGRIDRYSCTEVLTVVVGEHEESGATAEDAASDDGHGHGQQPKPTGDKPMAVVLWTNPHGGEQNNFIVAVAPEGGERSASSDDSSAASISFVRMMIPIMYRIRPDGVMDYAFKNMSPRETLLKIGEQATTEYLASSSLMRIMAAGRMEAEQAIAERVQLLADQHELGVEILGVTILDSHPPVEKVAPAYQNVIGAMEEREATILKAMEYQVQTLPAAESRAQRIMADAESYRFKVTTVAAAESERFNTQLGTYLVMPSMFRLKAYLDFLEKDCSSIRKFVVASGLDNEVYELNFEEKERLDLVDTDITSLTNP